MTRERAEKANPESRGALAGLRVLDLTRVLAGPWASQLLGDLGAQVVKIERPGRGDDTRGWGPPFVGAPDEGLSAYFLCANRNKRSIAIDFSGQRGGELLRRLAAGSDVVIENFLPGTLARYGLDYESLCAIKPDLIYCSITGFGQTGPERGRGGYDLLIQAMGGLMSVTGEADGGPAKVGVALADVITGLYAASGILAALRHRDATGEGQHIDIALLDAEIAALANQALNYLVSGEPPVRCGNAHPNIVPYQAFAASDGHLVLAVGNDAQFRNFCAAAGVPELADDPRYASNAARVEHREELIAGLEPLIAARGRDEWITMFEAAGVPCGPVNDLAEVFANPQVRARGVHLALGKHKIPQVANPLRMSATPPDYRLPPPRLGADTRAVLRELLDMGESELDTLEDAGVIQTRG